MTNTDAEGIPGFTRFGHAEAWRLGSLLVERAQAEQLPVVVVVFLGEQRAFQAALPGSSAMNDGWAERKAAIVRQFDRSSLAVYRRYAEPDPAAFATAFAAPADRFAPGDGALPLRVNGTLVGVLGISGLEDASDHDLGLWAIRRMSSNDGGDACEE